MDEDRKDERLFGEHTWVEIVQKVLEDYERNNNNTFTINAAEVFPGAALTLSKIRPINYEKDQLGEAYKSVCDYLFAHIQNGTAKIHESMNRKVEDVPEGEDVWADMLTGRTPLTRAGVASNLISSMESYAEAVPDFHENVEQWKPVAHEVMEFMADGIQATEDPSN